MAVIGAIGGSDDPYSSARNLSDDIFTTYSKRVRCCDLKMRIKLNGKIMDVEEDTTIADCLHSLELTSRTAFAVALNGEVVPKSNYTRVTLKRCDSLEIVNAIGGG